MRASKSSAAQSPSSSSPQKQSASSTPSAAANEVSPSSSSSSSSTTPLTTATSTATTTTPASVPNRLGGTPLVLTPVSQTSKGPRRSSRTEAALAAADKATRYDPDHYNPDGSLRTMHKLPHFEQSYAQAMQARYIRHTRPTDREKELSVQQIFDKK